MSIGDVLRVDEVLSGLETKFTVFVLVSITFYLITRHSRHALHCMIILFLTFSWASRALYYAVCTLLTVLDT